MSATNSTIASTSSPETATVALSTAASSKLVPAAVPAVSPWGKALDSNTPDTVSSAKSKEALTHSKIQKSWPAAESALKTTTSPKVKQTPQMPKVKSTGKEKWVKYDAEIIISSSTGGNQHNGNNQSKKKNSNNGNGAGNNNNSQKNNQNNGKKKQNTASSKAHRKDQNKKNDHHQGANGQEKKSHSKNTNASTPEKKLANSMSNISIDGGKPSEPDREESASPNTVPVENETTSGSNGENKSGTLNNGAIDGVDEQEIDNYSNQQRAQFKKQYRNSEPDLPSPNAQGGYKRRFNNKGFNPRNSFGGFQNIPMVNPGFNNYYMPMVIPPNSFSYGVPTQRFPPQQFGSVPQNPVSRSNSHSPLKGDYATINGVPQGFDPTGASAGFSPQFVQQQALFTPYQQDPNALIVSTVSYYFSDENLGKDIYLRRNMNSKGFVPLSVLINFNKLKSLTGGDMNVLLNALQNFPEVEIVNGKIRRSYNWGIWIVSFDKRLPAGQDDDEDESVTEATKDS